MTVTRLSFLYCQRQRRLSSSMFSVFLFLLFSSTIVSNAQGQRSILNHALIVSSSRYWFNYRHANNAFLVYEKLRGYGVPEENIILMIADDYPSNPRNPLKNGMYLEPTSSLYSANTRIDYRGDDVTVSNVLKVLLGKGQNRVLQTDSQSNILIYWTGHGGDGFFKFQDYEEITSPDIANVFRLMHVLGKYHEILFVVDTCQAFTLADELDDIPNIYAIGSSLKDQNSYAHHSNRQLGLSVIERYTHLLMDYISNHDLRKLYLKQTMVDVMNERYHNVLKSTVGYKQSNSVARQGTQIPLSDFFGSGTKSSSTNVELVQSKTAVTSLLDSFASNESNNRENNVLEDDSLPRQTARNETVQQNGGVEPTDLTFITLVLAIVGAMLWSFKRW